MDGGIKKQLQGHFNLPTVTDQKLLLVMAVEFNPQYVLSTATP